MNKQQNTRLAEQSATYAPETVIEQTPGGRGHNPAVEYLDIWSSAWLKKSASGRGSNGKLTPYGIQKLRELILELAVRGRLVPQNPEDEPASVLLEKIAEGKARLVKEGKIKKQPSLPVIEDQDRPNSLPDGWESARLGNIVRVLNGRAYKKHEMLTEGTPLLRVGNLFTSNEWYYSNLELEPDKYIDNGDLIYAWSASFGPFIWEGGRVIYHYHIWKLDFFDESSFDKRFLYRYLEAETDRIKASGSGIAMIHMTKDRMEKLVIPIPPLAEQRRIVAKVDELMALCDRLEQEQTDSLQAHQTLVETLLRTLVEAPDAKSAQQAWQRIAHHFDLLFTTEESIDQLKQTILQLAVMGKLVPQDPNDEPASVLLEKIADEKARLVKEGKIKKQKKLPEIAENEKPFELPVGWEWAFIPQVVTNDKYSIKRGPFGSTIKKDYFVPSGYKVYEQQNAIKDDFSLGQYYINNDKFNELKAFEVRPNDIIISCSGTVGKVAIAPSWMEAGIINQALLKLSLNENALTNRYFKILFPAFYMKTETLSELQGTAQKNMVSVATLKEEPFPLPPLAEQHRIVAKVDELMALCDALKARIQDAQTTQLHLADAVATEAVEC